MKNLSLETAPAIVLDAGAALNVLATARAAEIARAVGVRFVIARPAAGDCGALRNDAGDPVAIDFVAEQRNGSIELRDLTNDEVELFVSLAGRLGDSEAASLAMAYSRRLPLVTDEIVVVRAAHALQPSVATRSSAALMYAWGGSAPPAHLAEGLRRIESAAVFRPPATDRHAAWWREQTEVDAA
jgi:predicted nucleic acid-binding protein